MVSGTTSRIVVTVISGLAEIFTAFRLAYRWRTHRLWYDDAFAGFALACSLTGLVAFWVRTDVPGVGPLNQPKEARVKAYWIATIMFTMTLWAARMSLLFSTIRIIPSMMVMRRYAYYIAIFFGVMWIVLLCQKIYVCGHDLAWEKLAAPQCKLGTAVAGTELSFDFVSDILLIFLPLRVLWGINVVVRQRRMLFLIFSASIFVTAVSILHAVFVIGPSGLLEGLTANVEAGVSLIVANLAVVVMFIYRTVVNKNETTTGSGSGSLSAQRRGTSMGLKRMTRPDVTTLKFGADTRSTNAPIDSGLELDQADKKVSLRSNAERLEEGEFDTPFSGITKWDGAHAGAPQILITQETFVDHIVVDSDQKSSTDPL